MAVRNDEELNEFFNKNNLEFLGSGIAPFIHPTLYENIEYQEKRKGKKRNPGNQSILDIQKYQDTSEVLFFSRNAFECQIRKMVHETKEMKINENVFLFIQHYMERYICNILKMANNISLYSKRVKVVASDIEMVISILENRQPNFFDFDDDDYSSVVSNEFLEIIPPDIE